MRPLSISLAMSIAACGPQVAVTGADTSDTTSAATSGASATAASTHDDGDSEANDTGVTELDMGGTGDPDRCNADAPCLVDVLVVVDNSGTMADPQLALTRSLVDLVGRIEQRALEGHGVVDVQMMFTTTDMGHSLCTPFQKADYTPAMGAPTATGCLSRLNRFTGLGFDPAVREDVCEAMCTPDIVPDDPFVAFVGNGEDNVADGLVEDIDDDGDFDSRVAQAVACLAPQGIDGCGYEAPLEAMLQALNPDAPWNEGERPFLRDSSDVVILIATDESDCSMADEVALDPSYWEIRPGDDSGSPSSALCWNAGMACGAPDRNGVYSDCSTSDAALMPVSRYVDYLDYLDEDQARGVYVVAVTGVPVEGGVEDLVLRDWREDDLFPSELGSGLHADDKTYEYKIGPGCADVGREVRGLPNPRVNELCESANVPTVPEYDGTQCCVESICGAQIPLACVDDLLDVIADGHEGWG